MGVKENDPTGYQTVVHDFEGRKLKEHERNVHISLS